MEENDGSENTQTFLYCFVKVETVVSGEMVQNVHRSVSVRYQWIPFCDIGFSENQFIFFDYFILSSTCLRQERKKESETEGFDFIAAYEKLFCKG